MNPSPSSYSTVPSTPATGSNAIDRQDAPVGSFKYYALCGMGGALACGLTTSLYPKEIVVVVGPFEHPSKAPGMLRAAALEFVSTPTAARCWTKGVAKFGFYDGFKDLYAKMVGKDAHQLRFPISVVSALTAQRFAFYAFFDYAELLRATKGLSQAAREPICRDYVERAYPHFRRRMRNAAIQFPCYEAAAEALYARFKPKANCSKFEQIQIAFTAGCIAGLVCAVVTHPFDMLPPFRFADDLPYATAAEQPGFRAFASRSVSMAKLVALQWTIYEGFKIATGVSNSPTAASSVKSRKQPEMPESLRKKLEELKLKKMEEQKSKINSSNGVPSRRQPYSD